MALGTTTLVLAFDLGAAVRGEAPGGWFWDIYTPNIVFHYGEEGSGVHALLCGGSNGHLYQYTGPDDAGIPFSMEFTTPSRDQSDPRSNKLYGDIMLDCDTNGLTVAATPFLDNNLTRLPAVTVNTPNRALVTIPLNDHWETARNISLNVVCPISGVRPLFYIWEPRWTFESAPIAALSWEISPTTYGMTGFKHYGLCKITHVSSSDLRLIFTIDNAVQPPIVIPNSGASVNNLGSVVGNYIQTIFRVPVMKGKIHKIRLESTTSFRLDTRDSFIEVKDWASDSAYSPLRVFGDFSLVEG